jgi:hypothetical protein
VYMNFYCLKNYNWTCIKLFYKIAPKKKMYFIIIYHVKLF